MVRMGKPIDVVRGWKEILKSTRDVVMYVITTIDGPFAVYRQYLLYGS